MVMVAEKEFRYLQTSLDINRFMVYGDGCKVASEVLGQSTNQLKCTYQ